MRTRRTPAVILAGASLLIALAVLVVWLARLDSVARVAPFLMVMMPSAALAAVFASIAVLFLCLGRPRLAAVVATIPVIMGLASLGQSALGTGPRAGRLLVEDGWLQGPAASGPMPVIGAIAVGLVGLTVAVKALQRPGQLREAWIATSCLTVLVLAMASAAGHLAGSSFAIRWGAQREVSIPGIACAILLATALLLRSFRLRALAAARIPLWVPALVCFGLVVFDVITPANVAAGMLYVPLVLCALWFERPTMAYVFAAVASALIVFGFYASPPADPLPAAAAFNRFLAVVTVWIVALLVVERGRATAAVERGAKHLAAAQRVAEVRSFEIDFAAQARRKVTGYVIDSAVSPASASNWPAFSRAHIPAEDLVRLDRLVAGAASGASPEMLEYSFIAGDDEICAAELTADLVRRADGTVAGLIGVVRDVTQNKRTAAREAALEARLRHAGKLEALGALAGSIAHDLNNTLVPATTLVPMLIEDAQGPTERRSLEIVLAATRRARDLVREVVIFSRRAEPEPGPVQLDRLVEDSLVLLRAGIPARIAVTSALAPVPPVRAHEGQIYQIVLNLATNAAQAIDGSGSIRIGTRRIDHAASGRAMVCLFVEDDGKGMDDATAARIFEPYFTTSPGSANAGFGLAIVSGIVAALDGLLEVASRPGAGCRIEVLFPLDEERRIAAGVADGSRDTDHR